MILITIIINVARQIIIYKSYLVLDMCIHIPTDSKQA